MLTSDEQLPTQTEKRAICVVGLKNLNAVFVCDEHMVEMTQL
jgi:hypothetical protein